MLTYSIFNIKKNYIPRQIPSTSKVFNKQRQCFSFPTNLQYDLPPQLHSVTNHTELKEIVENDKCPQLKFSHSLMFKRSPPYPVVVQIK